MDTRVDPRTLAVAAGAGVAAALAGAVAWGLIVKVSDFEVGIVALGIGYLVGWAVARAARGRHGVALQAVAVAAALAGILLGKYLAFAWVLQEEAAAAGVSLGLLSAETRELFRDSLGSVFGWFDLLWVGIAVFTAWRMLEPRRDPDPVAPA